MIRRDLREIVRVCAIGAAMLACAATAMAQARAETFAADAKVTRADGTQASAKITATIQSFATDAERDALVAAVKKGGTAARDLLAKRPDAGSIQVGNQTTPVKYAYSRAAGAGRLITLVTAQAIHYVGGDRPDAQPKAGYDLGLVLLDLSATPGTGEIAPAAKVRVDAQNAIVTEDYGGVAMVHLSNVVRK
jgi:hypothetical protein